MIEKESVASLRIFRPSLTDLPKHRAEGHRNTDFPEVYANKAYQFKIASADGKATLATVGEGAPFLGSIFISIDFGVMETLPDGKSVLSPVRVDTLETASPATENLGKVIITGKTAGDANLEITIEQTRGIVFIGSRLLDPGTITNPLRCSATVVFPNLNPPAAAEVKKEELNEREAKRAAKKMAKAAEEKLKDDRVDLKWIDGKRHSITFDQVVNAGGEEFNGPGISAAEIQIATYGKKKFLFNASPNSVLKLANPKPASLNEGFSLQWSPDPAKNQDGKARFAIEVK